ncbi:MAG: hypothetical protein LBC56_05230 [Oscillospiraceae bacterium]|jgi:hypothetical protein|nr:hypothetical protein [Oscillospiraceae bacterium]
MNDNYIKLFDEIKADGNFKARLLYAMQEAAARPEKTKESDKMPLQKIFKIAVPTLAAVCALLLVFAFFIQPKATKSSPGLTQSEKKDANAGETDALYPEFAAEEARPAEGAGNYAEDANLEIADATEASLYGEDVGGLPKLNVAWDALGSGGYGYEAYMVYDISELDNGNPWTPDAKLDKLPVFENQYVAGFAGIPSGLSPEEMIAKASQAAGALGLKIDKTYTNPTEELIQKMIEKLGDDEKAIAQNTAIYEGVAVCGDVEISADAYGTVTVRYLKPPGPVAMSLPAYQNERDGNEMFLNYFLQQYKGFVDMENPAPDVWGDRNTSEERNVQWSAFEKTGGLTQQILGYFFNRVQFYFNEEGSLWLIRRWKTDVSQKVGDYPIISADEAKRALLAGNFITTVPEDFPGEAAVAKAELVYRTAPHEKLFMPYYKFYLELPNPQLKNMEQYGAYYVPAVRSEYLGSMPVWDGGFN